ncbi:thioesterase [Burkholderia cenocepacia]|uniref:thioesterase II family protein n=1 Tax=Burkholderia cenocepacia TaxID=95486 RepID=UPI000F56D8FA|nr:alpha/beta fold hydrolase [Burkholderia cenocepacia]RQU33429.1 thioesterase [Burkholderia cenocepacia]RQU58580.1 thioesterase [Burkholderia cenocepacia]
MLNMSQILSAAASMADVPLSTKALTMVCFPHAGGNAPTYHALASHLPSDLHIVAYQAPARGCRFSEPPAASLDAILNELEAPLAALTARPCLFLGHSFGGILAFEAVRRLRRSGLRLPDHLVISGSFPPNALVSRRAQWAERANCSDGELFDCIAAGGGVPMDLLAHRDAFLPFMPSMRAEFAILRDYVPAVEPPLPLSLTTLCGKDDDLVPPEAMADWSSYVAGETQHHVLPGGHHYFDSHTRTLAAHLHEIATQIVISRAY